MRRGRFLASLAMLLAMGPAFWLIVVVIWHGSSPPVLGTLVTVMKKYGSAIVIVALPGRTVPVVELVALLQHYTPAPVEWAAPGATVTVSGCRPACPGRSDRPAWDLAV